MTLLETQTTSAKCAGALLDVVPQVMRVVRAEMRSHRGGELSVPQFRALVYLDRHPGSPLLAVAAHVGLTPPSMSKLIDGLIARRLVSRQKSAADRRCITLSLTTQGRSTLERARRHTKVRLAEALETLAVAERATVMEALAVLRRTFSIEGEEERR